MPYLGSDQKYPARMDANVRGEPIRFKDRVYARGIGVHSYSRLSFPLDGKTYAAFRTRYAIDPPPDVNQSVVDVTVRVKVDNKVVHEQAHVRTGTLSPVVTLDVAGARLLTLEVDYGDHLDSGDHLDWIEPALLKVKPAEASPAAPQAAPGATTVTSSPATAPATRPADAAKE